ncbi:MAG: 2-oxoacid:acceptor oxidoreductase family protein [Acetobacteraceae bacterium]|nr:2-oxoacid:acceptor oxidoreductase family protein [Acetobacteraceae bacterium]
MSELLEIRWHGRGGQGAKTAAVLLAEVVSAAGRYIQGFPEYGPERMGAPVLAFNRISDRPIDLHCHVTEPDVVVVLDPTLLGKAGVSEGLAADGSVLVNTPRPPGEIRRELGLSFGRVFTVDASQIAVDTLGKNIPNTPMIGALVRVTGVMGLDEFLPLMKVQLQEKFKAKGDVVEGNLKAIERAYREVRGE